MIIPRGKEVKIRVNNALLNTNVPLIIEDDITLNISSTFEPFFGGGAGGGGNSVLSQFAQFASARFGTDIGVGSKYLGFQVWKSTQPIDFSLSVGLYMETNALLDVVEPMKRLMKLPVPTEGLGGTLIPPGPNVITAIADAAENVNASTGGLFSSLSDFASSQEEGFSLVSVNVEKIIHFSKTVVKKAEPTFSIETDTNGYPIWGKIMLDFSTLFIATGIDIDLAMGSTQEGIS